MVDFVEICNDCARQVIIKAAKRILNSDKICRSYCDFYFGVTFWNTAVCNKLAPVFEKTCPTARKRNKSCFFGF